ncbi:hypothetical protein LAD67_17745 [Escherichia coli]|nr:hypothetical protein [Escherichia coli]
MALLRKALEKKETKELIEKQEGAMKKQEFLDFYQCRTEAGSCPVFAGI